MSLPEKILATPMSWANHSKITGLISLQNWILVESSDKILNNSGNQPWRMQKFQIFVCLPDKNLDNPLKISSFRCNLRALSKYPGNNWQIQQNMKIWADANQKRFYPRIINNVSKSRFLLILKFPVILNENKMHVVLILRF